MKKTKIMILAAVAMLMAACSSDDESQKQSSQPESGWRSPLLPVRRVTTAVVPVPTVPCV